MGMRIDTFQVPDEIWKDKSIPVEAKYIFCYIYSKAFDRPFTDINVGEYQKYRHISNVGFRNNLKRLVKYITYNEYSTGMYTVKLN